MTIPTSPQKIRRELIDAMQIDPWDDHYEMLPQTPSELAPDEYSLFLRGRRSISILKR